VSLYPIFIGTAWFWVGIASAIVVALTGTLTRLRRLPVAATLPCYAVVLLLWLNFAFANARSLWHLLPTPASLAALFSAAGLGFDEASKYAPPVPELRGMVLLAAAGIGIAAIGADLIAVRLSNAALAGLPLLLLFTEPFTLSVSRGWAGTTIAFCAGVAGYLALLSSEARDRIREWGAADDNATVIRSEPDTRTLAAAGRRIGFASVVVALCLPLLIPGLHTTRLFGGQPGIGGSAGDGGGGGGGGSGGAAAVGLPANPDQQIASELTTKTPVPALTYTFNSTDPYGPGYLPVYTLDQLTDSGWKTGPSDLVPVGSALPGAPGLTVTSGAGIYPVTTNIQLASPAPVENISQGYALPVPFPANAVKVRGSLTADKNTLAVYARVASANGLAYTVTSRGLEPSQGQLAAAPPPTAAMVAAYASVPAAYSPLRTLARQKTAGATTEIQQAIDLQNWLSTTGGFKYTTHAGSVVNAAELTTFLSGTKKGYCQQFSVAMATLARLLGIPARVEVGFTDGTPVNQTPEPGETANTFLVTSHDAHAWPELYFQGYGWLRFEPTPGGSTGQETANSPSYTLTGAGLNGNTGLSQGLSGGAAGASAAANSHLKEELPVPGGAHGQAARPSQLSPWAIVGLVLAFLIVAGAVAPWCARRIVRQRRWQGRGTGTGRANRATLSSREGRVRARDVAWAHAAWAELRDDLADHGAAALPSESPRTVAERAGTGLGLAAPAREALGRIAMAEERARYAPAPADSAGLHTDSATVRRAIAASVPRETRLRARLFPASVVTPALNALASVSDLSSSLVGARGGKKREEG
jgi:transglutaminase-like putative cysteine protease